MMPIAKHDSKNMQTEVISSVLNVTTRNQCGFSPNSLRGKIHQFSVRIFKILILVWFSALISAAYAQTNQVGFWWKSSEPGWGLSVQQQGTNTFAVWYTYNTQAQPIWYSLSCTFSGSTCAGDLYTAAGTPFYQITAGANQTATKEGTGTLTLSGSNINLSYTVGSVTQIKSNLERFNISTSVPTCTLQSASRTAASNYTDLWWGGANAAGWGLQITHQGDQVFAGWYAYGDNRAATWITAQGTQDAANPKRFTGLLSQVPTGTAFSQPFSTTGPKATTIGTFELNFSDGEKGEFKYVLPSQLPAGRSLPIERFAIAGGATNVCTTTPVTTAKTNILLIIADDQGVDSSNQYSYSQDKPRTPTLDALAASGIVFDNAWATPSCTTTRGSLITGKHGVHSGISFVPAIMDTSTNTLQRYLRASTASASYQTAVIGKWHLGGANPANSHPTDSGVGYYAGNITGVLPNYYSWPLVQDGVTTTSTVYHTTKITDLAIDWVSKQSQPWFLWLAYSAPHDPFHLPPTTLQSRTTLTGTTTDIAARPREYYLAAIEAMDAEIGRLLSTMSAETRANTLIVYIGDNGTPTQTVDASVYTAGKVKNSLYEGGIRVPMVVSGKGVGRSNARESALVNTVDFYATIASIAGNSVTQVNDGVSFASLLQTGGTTARQYNYSEFQSDTVSGWTVRNAQYKLLQNLSGTQELYDLSKDLKEQTNLLTSGTDYSAIVNTLKAQGDTIRK
jgi:arylsulfatase A-like enzyme